MNDLAEAWRREFRCFLRWLRVLEATVPPRRQEHGRHFKGQLFEVYCRAGWGDPMLDGASYVCLATVSVRPAFRGQGFFGALLDFLDAAGPMLRARYLTVERVGNPGLARKLSELGFTEVGEVHEGSSTYWRKRPQ